jgi:predicted nucleic acid-binding protein
MNLVDSSGWLEYFAGGSNHDFFTPAVEDTPNLIVSVLNLYEVFKRILQQRDESSALQAAAVMQQAQVIDLDSSISLSAAKLGVELKLPLADSIILATARRFDATLWTQDRDFAELPGVRYRAKKGK